MKNRRKRNADEQVDVFARTVPIAQRTRLALKASWQQHSENFVRRKHVSTFEVIASKVFSGGYPTKPRDCSPADYNQDHYSQCFGEHPDQAMKNVMKLNFDKIKLSGKSKDWLQDHGTEVVECVLDRVRNEVEKQMRIFFRSNKSFCEIQRTGHGVSRSKTKINKGNAQKKLQHCRKVVGYAASTQITGRIDEEEEMGFNQGEVEPKPKEFALALCAQLGENLKQKQKKIPEIVLQDSEMDSVCTPPRDIFENEILEECYDNEDVVCTCGQENFDFDYSKSLLDPRTRRHLYEGYVLALSAEFSSSMLDRGYRNCFALPMKRGHDLAIRGGAYSSMVMLFGGLKTQRARLCLYEDEDQPESEEEEEVGYKPLPKSDLTMEDLLKSSSVTPDRKGQRQDSNICITKVTKEIKRRTSTSLKSKMKNNMSDPIKLSDAALFQKLLLEIAKEGNPPTIHETEAALGAENAEDPENAEGPEMEKMWKDMQLAWKGSELDKLQMNSVGLESEHDNSFDESDSEFGCPDDEHEFVLDEEIGLLCKYCGFVKQEIHSILPPVDFEPRKWKGWYDYDPKMSSHLGQNPFEDEMEEDISYESHLPLKYSVWGIIPDLREKMYAHQRQGFEFLWRNVAGGLVPEKMKPPTSDEVGGCILSHAPGTGKTMLIISFLKTYLDLFPRSRPLLVTPVNMLYAWEREFEKWGVDLPFHILNKSDSSWAKCSRKQHEENEDNDFGKTRQKNLRRVFMIKEWHEMPSVLGISYNLFLYLTGYGGHNNLSYESKHVGKLLLEKPGIIILDEGHQVRNSRSKIWKAFQNVHTKLKIIMSGTVFQNNFKELFNTLYLVRPGFVQRFMEEEILEFKDEADSSEHKARVMRRYFMEQIGHKIESGDEEIRENLARFRHMTRDFVHCYEGKVLSNLPGLRDFAVILTPTSTQDAILREITEINTSQKLSNFEYETVVSVVCIHPGLYKDFDFQILSKIQCAEDLRKDPYQGCKTKFVLDLIELATIMEEKVLLFSQNIPPLNYMAKILETKMSLIKGTEVLQLDGGLATDKRQEIIDKFNDPEGAAKVLLASIKTCSEGINLTGASRVVFLDLVWNPSVQKQAVSRAFRLGQKRQVYVYRLIASGTHEEEKYRRTVWKDCLSKLVFSSAKYEDEEGDIDDDDEDCQPNEKNSGHTSNCEDKVLNKLWEMDCQGKTFHEILEHSNIAKSDTRDECLRNYFSKYNII